MKFLGARKPAFMNIWISLAMSVIILVVCTGTALGIAMAAKRNHSGAEASNGAICQNFGNNCRLIPPSGECSKKETRVIDTITRYYRPLPGQQKYNQGSYEAEKKMEGDLVTATGVNVGIGAIAVEDNPENPNYIPYGTVITVPGYGTGVAVDRGSAIRGSHLDLWVGEGDEGRINADKTDRNVTVELCFHDELKTKDDVVKAVKRVCDGNASNDCPAADFSSTITAGNGDVVLDPGHGNNDDRGFIGDKTEAGNNFDIAVKTKNILEGKGVKVVITKANAEADPTLPERVSMANASNASVFVSLHSNSSGGPGPIGIVYCAGPANGQVDYQAASCATTQVGLQSRQLSKNIVNNITSTLGLSNARFWGGDLGVLTGLKMPATLIEMFAHDQQSDINKVSGKEDQLANAIASGILSSLGK